MWHFNFSSKYQIKHRHWRFHIQIISFTAIFLIWNDTYLQIQVSIWSIPNSCISFSRIFDISIFFDSCWNLNIYSLFGFFQSTISDFFSALFINFSNSSTLFTSTRSLHYSERSLSLLTNFSSSITSWTNFFGYSWYFFHPSVADFLFTS